MAKSTGLGKGLGALLKENSEASAEVAVSVAAMSGGNAEKSAAPTRSSKIPACIEVDETGGLWIDPALLVPNPKQPRQVFNEKQLNELCDSIRENGILQPIVIEQASEKEFYIIAGERRTRAARMAGLKKVPVHLSKFDEIKKLELALVENIQRADLNPIEEATAYYNLVQMSDLTQDEVAKRVGKNRSTVANAIRLLKLPEDIQQALANQTISSGHARALLMVKNDADMRVMFGKIVGNGLSVREAEAMAEQLNNGGRAAAAPKKAKQNKKDPDVALFEQELRNKFGVKGVKMDGTMDKGSITIEFGNKADFERVCAVLGIEG